MTRISSLALACACGGILLGCAVISAGSIVPANEAKLQLAVDAPRVLAPAPAQQVAPAKIQIAVLSNDEPRRAVRIVYVGPVTAW